MHDTIRELSSGRDSLGETKKDNQMGEFKSLKKKKKGLIPNHNSSLNN